MILIRSSNFFTGVNLSSLENTDPIPGGFCQDPDLAERNQLWRQTKTVFASGRNIWQIVFGPSRIRHRSRPAPGRRHVASYCCCDDKPAQSGREASQKKPLERNKLPLFQSLGAGNHKNGQDETACGPHKQNWLCRILRFLGYGYRVFS